jgi:hypothetical protein
MEEETIERILESDWNIIIWWFPQYKWKMLALLKIEKPIAEV